MSALISPPPARLPAPLHPVGRTGHLRALVSLSIAGLALVACATGAQGSGALTPTVSVTVRPLIVDTDMSTDDVMALAYLVNVPGYDLKAVTVEGTGVTHCPIGAGNAARLLGSMGRTVPTACGTADPVGDGHANPEAWRAASDSLYGLALNGSGSGSGETAVELMTRTLASSEVPVDILAIGPVTTIAQAIAATPDLIAHIHRVVLMGGAYEVAGNVTDTENPGSPEWNIWADAQAAARLFASGIPLVEVPLDATNAVPVTPEVYAELAADHRAAGADVVFELLARNTFLVSSGQFFWDPLAAAVLEDPAVVDLSALRVRVGTDDPSEVGRTIRDETASPVQVALSADQPRFASVFLAGLHRGAPRSAPFSVAGSLAIRYDGTRCDLPTPPATAGVYAVTYPVALPANVVAMVVTLHPGHRWQEVIDFVASIRPQTGNPEWADLTPVPPAIGGVDPVVSVSAGTSGLACARLDAQGTAIGVALSAPFTVTD